MVTKKRKSSLAEIDKMIVTNSITCHKIKGPHIGHTPISRSLASSISRAMRIKKPKVGKMHGAIQ